MQKLVMVFVLWLSVLSPLYSCSAFLVARNGTVLAGNNEDSRYPLTKMWVVPRNNGNYGRIYFGYDDLVSQGDLPETAKMGVYQFERYHIPGTDRVYLGDTAPTISLRKEEGRFYMRRNYGYGSEYQLFPEDDGRYFALTRHFKFTLEFDEGNNLKLLVNLHQLPDKPWVMELEKQ